MNLEIRKKEIEVRLEEIRGLADKETDSNKLDEMEKEVDNLNEERKTIDRKLAMASKFNYTPIIETNKEDTADLEQRGKDLKEGRTITVATGNILLPTHQDPTINGVPFNDVSTLVDKVGTINLQGGETYKKAYVKSHSTGNATAEGAAYGETEPEFGYATITKTKITAYSEITEELEKLPLVDYQAEVIKNIDVSLKKKISQQILLGAGTANTFTGIFSASAEALTDAPELEINAITDTTLDDIVYAYGGNEDVEGGACLILNKNDLRAFAKLRTTEGRKVHIIDYVNKTIDGIPYVINSNCKSVTDPNTTAGEYCIAYGALTNYEVPVFSPVEIAKSTDYKFKDGIICYKASVFTGGNVVGYNGFLRVKKVAAAGE